ncbi:MAG: glycoside hydrolase family 3 protein [Sporomusaceae bacterium]|nr:glycoside hydrolase family 3 protein [Sporomusaceae bacterium]
MSRQARRIMRLLLLSLLFCLTAFSAAAAQPASNGFTPEVIPDAIEDRLKTMSMEEKVGQLFIAAFRQEESQPVRAVTPKLRASIKQYHLGGVILFAENFQSVDQTVALNQELATLAGPVPLWIAVDQEGGRVNRYFFGTALPGNMAVGAGGNNEGAYQTGYILGQEMSALGINLALAPVLDVNSNQENPVIGIRSFGADPIAVSRLGKAYIAGLHDGGVLAVMKHFPGHGDTFVDSHVGLPIVKRDKEALATMELRPFIDNLATADMVMVGHIAFPALDATKVLSQDTGEAIYLPASLSPKVTTKLLREELGYEGVVITDALEMKAIAKHFGAKQAALMALQAGADILLMPENLPEAYEAVLTAVRSGRIAPERVDTSVRRILRLKAKLLPINKFSQDGAEKMVGNIAAKDTAAQIAAAAVTLVKNEAGAMPLQLTGHEKIVLAAPTADTIKLMQDFAQTQCQDLGFQELQFSPLLYQESGSLTLAEMQTVQAADIVIMALPREEAGAAALAAFSRKQGKRVIGIAIDTPYNMIALPYLSAYLAVYGKNASNMEAGMAAVFGRLSPAGRLPVPVYDDGKLLFPLGFTLAKNLTAVAGKE